jgi:hypothetical protein
MIYDKDEEVPLHLTIEMNYNTNYNKHFFEVSKFKKIAMKGKLQKNIGGKQEETLASSQSTCKERCVEGGPCTIVTSLLFWCPSFLAHIGYCLH